MSQVKIDEDIRKIDILKLKVINHQLWWKNKRTVKVYNITFTDDNGHKSIWRAKKFPPTKYIYLEDTNYNIAIRKNKLKKINSLI